MSISNWRPENIFYLTILSIAGISGICKLANDANIPEKIQKGIQKLDIGKKKNKANENQANENQAKENEAKENEAKETDNTNKVPGIKLQDLEEGDKNGDQNGDQNDVWQTNNKYDPDDKDITEITGGKSNHRRTKRNQTKQKQNQKYRKTQRRIKNNGILKIKI